MIFFSTITVTVNVIYQFILPDAFINEVGVLLYLQLLKIAKLMNGGTVTSDQYMTWVFYTLLNNEDYLRFSKCTTIYHRNDAVQYSRTFLTHYSDVIMGALASQITSLTIVYSTVYSGADQRIHQSSASLAFMRWIHRRPVNSPHKWPITRKMYHLMTSWYIRQWHK